MEKVILGESIFISDMESMGYDMSGLVLSLIMQLKTPARAFFKTPEQDRYPTFNASSFSDEVVLESIKMKEEGSSEYSLLAASELVEIENNPGTYIEFALDQ